MAKQAPTPLKVESSNNKPSELLPQKLAVPTKNEETPVAYPEP